MTSEKDRVFPTLKLQDKADQTTQAARAIVVVDAQARVAKTVKLKALWLALEAEAAAHTAPAGKTRGGKPVGSV